MTTTLITADEARWVCDPEQFEFKSTEGLLPTSGILGQDEAVESLQFGLENRVQGNNVFVRGLSGFGRMTLIHQMIKETATDAINLPDQCYVHNFEAVDQPRLLELDAGLGKDFKRAMDRFSEYAKTDLPEFLASDIVKSKQRNLTERAQEEIREIGAPFDQELQDAGLAVVPVQIGQNMLPTILPLIDGKPVSHEELQEKKRDGKVTSDEINEIEEKILAFQKKLSELGQEIANAQLKNREALEDMFVAEARAFVSAHIDNLKRRFNIEGVHDFLDQIEDDLINVKILSTDTKDDFTRHYKINLVRSLVRNSPQPVVSVTNPNLTNLVGRIDQELANNGIFAHSDHLMIKPGALLEANGGFLIVEAQDILREPGAWAVLLRTLKTGLFEMGANDLLGVWGGSRLRPEPIPIDIKVVLVGDPETYYLLHQYEPRFSSLFKVLADFADTIPRDKEGIEAYVNIVTRLVARDKLLHFSSSAIAKLIEHGSRICAHRDQLTSKFGRIADIAREAEFLAREASKVVVEGCNVTESIRRSRRRAELPAKRFRRLIADGTLKIDFEGLVVGQVNGLAVTSEGPLTFGFPTRITASIGPGRDGAINIERESDMSGNVHTKGFLILKGLLRRVLALDHPFAFSASIAFEQTYGGIDGDSASAAEFCCLISALTGLPIDQSFAMTGAIDQHGNILPIGAVTEKIEGFFEACKVKGLSGDHTVIIPRANVGDLMLSEEVVAAIAAGEFAIHAVAKIDEILPLLLRDKSDSDETLGYLQVIERARVKAIGYWQASTKSPQY